MKGGSRKEWRARLSSLNDLGHNSPSRPRNSLLLVDLILLRFPDSCRGIRRTMAEEQRCQEGHRLCTNNCGFSGSPATMDLCSKCYHDRRPKEEQAASAKMAVEKNLLPFSASVAKAEPDSPLSSLPESTAEPSTMPKIAEERHAAPPGRCRECRKRVGLTGFRCRCGLTFCGTHRYPEQHSCSFDFKGAGREAIARDNPAIKAAKLNKI